MSNEEWNKLQETVFLKLFSNTNGVSSKLVIKALERRRNVWQKLYSIVGRELDPNNKRYSIMGIDKISILDKVYLVLRTGLWEFVVIDINDMRCVVSNEAMMLFNEGAFEKFRGIDENDMQYLSFEILSNNSI